MYCILKVHSVHTHIFIPFEDRELTGLKVDIASFFSLFFTHERRFLTVKTKIKKCLAQACNLTLFIHINGYNTWSLLFVADLPPWENL